MEYSLRENSEKNKENPGQGWESLKSFSFENIFCQGNINNSSKKIVVLEDEENNLKFLKDFLIVRQSLLIKKPDLEICFYRDVNRFNIAKFNCQALDVDYLIADYELHGGTSPEAIHFSQGRFNTTVVPYSAKSRYNNIIIEAAIENNQKYDPNLDLKYKFELLADIVIGPRPEINEREKSIDKIYKIV